MQDVGEQSARAAPQARTPAAGAGCAQGIQAKPRQVCPRRAGPPTGRCLRLGPAAPPRVHSPAALPAAVPGPRPSALLWPLPFQPRWARNWRGPRDEQKRQPLCPRAWGSAPPATRLPRFPGRTHEDGPLGASCQGPPTAVTRNQHQITPSSGTAGCPRPVPATGSDPLRAGRGRRGRAGEGRALLCGRGSPRRKPQARRGC